MQELFLSDYPRQLRELPDPPKKLWLRGEMPTEETKILAVVGSRALSRYGREACDLLISGLRGYQVSIVSGLALGADAAAHRAALSSGLHTIAIPGSGLDDSVIGPRTNLGLALEILDAGGALLSENDPDHLAAPYDFPSRNRIMVGIADAVLIIEAGPKSGTLITARLAGEYNRELLCVPHRIGDPHGFGADLFLRLGATYVSNSKHVLEALGITPREDESEEWINSIIRTISQPEKMIYELLEIPKTRDEVIRSVNIPAHHALTILISLEIKGIIKEEFGAWRRL